MFSCICIAITAPMNSDMIMTSGMESRPSFATSETNRLPLTFHLSGKENTRAINMQYLPSEANERDIIILYKYLLIVLIRVQNY